MKVVETDHESPICPHCEKPVTEVKATKIKAQFGVRFLYFCGHCRKVLGVSHRKGFWMG